jgi:hypothetical protein
VKIDLQNTQFFADVQRKAWEAAMTIRQGGLPSAACYLTPFRKFLPVSDPDEIKTE